MILGGGSNCQGCGCSAGCPECNHFDTDSCYNADARAGTPRAVFLATVNGTNIPNSSPFSFTVTPPSSVYAACNSTVDPDCGAHPVNNPWLATFQYNQANVGRPFPDTDSGYTSPEGCVSCEPRQTVFCYIRDSFSDLEIRKGRDIFYRTGACSDTGGTALLQSAFADRGQVYNPCSAGCNAAIISWLNSLSFSATFTMPACICPP